VNVSLEKAGWSAGSAEGVSFWLHRESIKVFMLSKTEGFIINAYH